MAPHGKTGEQNFFDHLSTVIGLTDMTLAATDKGIAGTAKFHIDEEASGIYIIHYRTLWKVWSKTVRRYRKRRNHPS
jgi:hypothetical protein